MLSLLRSDSVLERKAGVETLGRFNCSFGFDPEALEEDRQRSLAEIEPWLHRLIGKSETEVRVMLLSRAGFELTGQPNDSWLSTLLAAASTNNHDAVPQALWLIASIVGDNRCRQFSWPQPQRAKALRAYLEDLGKLSP